jgi:hypothetical protein
MYNTPKYLTQLKMALGFCYGFIETATLVDSVFFSHCSMLFNMAGTFSIPAGVLACQFIGNNHRILWGKPIWILPKSNAEIVIY